MLSFDEVYNMLIKEGPGKAIYENTIYSIEARLLSKGNRKGEKTILAKPKKGGTIYIHKDCWGRNETCQQSWAGGVYNGKQSIYDWYNWICKHSNSLTVIS